MTASAIEAVARPRPATMGDVLALADALAGVARQFPTLDPNGRAAIARDLLERVVAGYGRTDGLLDALQEGVDSYTARGLDSWFLLERVPAGDRPASWFATVAIPPGFTHPDSDDGGETVCYDRPTLDEALTCALLALGSLQPGRTPARVAAPSSAAR